LFLLFIPADAYLRHPNTYLPKYIQSETDGENTDANGSLLMHMGINGVDIGPHQIVDSDEDEVPAYGFPSQGKRNNRRGLSTFNHEGETSSLLGYQIESNSDISVPQLCEIDDSEYEEEGEQNARHENFLDLSRSLTNSNGSSRASKKSVQWNNNIKHTDV